MLEYENEMFLSAMQEDGLTISAKGLGLETVFLSLLKVAASLALLRIGRLMEIKCTTDYTSERNNSLKLSSVEAPVNFLAFG
jgi:hypothetical protein